MCGVHPADAEDPNVSPVCDNDEQYGVENYSTVDSYHPKRYPKTREEVATILERANKYNPANVPMLVVESFTPSCSRPVREETRVTVGMVVNALYKTQRWVFVRTPLEDAGFVPFKVVVHIGSSKQRHDFSQQFPEDTVLIPDVPPPRQRQRPSLKNSLDSGTTSTTTNDSYCLPTSPGKHLPETSLYRNTEVSFMTTRSQKNKSLLESSTPNSLIYSSRSSTSCISRTHSLCSLSLTQKRCLRSASTGDIHLISSQKSDFTSRVVGDAIHKVCRDMIETATKKGDLSPCLDCTSSQRNSSDCSLETYDAECLRNECSKFFVTSSLQNMNSVSGCSRGDTSFFTDADLYWICDRDISEQTPVEATTHSSCTRLYLCDNVEIYSSLREVCCDNHSSNRPTTLTILFDYDALDENDVTVRQHDTVTLLFEDDPDWLWVRKHDGAQGFIPRSYASDLNALQLEPGMKSTYL